MQCNSSLWFVEHFNAKHFCKLKHFITLAFIPILQFLPLELLSFIGTSKRKYFHILTDSRTLLFIYLFIFAKEKYNKHSKDKQTERNKDHRLLRDWTRDSICKTLLLMYYFLGRIILSSLEIWRNETPPQTLSEKTLPFFENWRN